MMKKKNSITMKSLDLPHLAYSAIKAANSKSVSDNERCVDVLRHMKNLNLSGKDLRDSKVIPTLSNLRDHENPKIRMEADVLFSLWLKTLYSSGRNVSSCNKSQKKKEDLSRSHVIAVENKKKSKSFAATSKNPRSDGHKTGEVKRSLKKCDVRKKQQPPKVSQNPKSSTLALKKNSTKMLELFEVAKKYADVANTKGLLAAKEETSICVHSLSLLISFPINSTATETKLIMEKLERLTKHKDRKICNTASALLNHWRQNIKEQQH